MQHLDIDPIAQWNPRLYRQTQGAMPSITEPASFHITLAPTTMNYIGIDPSADTFTCSIFKEGECIGNPRTLESTPEGPDELLSWISKADCTRHNTLICVENTGVFSEMLLYQLHRAAWPVVLIEPIKVHRAFEKDRPKTDEIDSLKIAEYAWRYRDKLTL